jgi:outer membrane immunogenic protein
MRRHLLAGTAALAITVALSGPLSAADMPVKAAPFTPAIFNWTGWYIGGHVGYADGNGDPSGRWGGSGGAVGGLHGGYNIQAGNWVYGWEADVDAVGLSGNHKNSDNSTSFSGNVMASLRGRLGITADRTLFYATAGGALLNFTLNTDETSAGKKYNAFGGVVGGGIEHAYNKNLSFRLEALYYMFDKKVSFDGEDPQKLKNTWTVRTGFTYKFDGSDLWGKGPVVAKY